MTVMGVTENPLMLRYSDPEGEHTFLLDCESISIGRLPDQNIVLRDSFVSRRHAVINLHNGNFELVDLNSSHGTYVNGTRIERVILKPGDKLQYGSLNACQMKFDFKSGHETPSKSPLADGLLSALSVLSLRSQDVHPVAREMEQLNFLLNAARQLNAGGAIEDIFRVLLQLSIQLTGVERGFVFLRENGEMRLALGLRSDGRIVEEDSTISRNAMRKAIESESKFSVSDTIADDYAGNWASVMANSIRSIYCIPLRKHISQKEPNRLLGLLYLDSQIGAGNLNAVDHQVLDTVATEAATLLHNALLAESDLKSRMAAEELAVAAKIHASMMSIALPTLSYAVLQGRSVPCLAIGGDFYHAVALDDCVGVAIADVSGKGVPASIVAATLQGIIHAQLLTGQSLAEIAALVNQFLCVRNVGKYATMILLKLFPSGLVQYINCGHVPPIVVSESEVRRLEESNLIVGLIPGASYTSAQCTLQPGERILLTTDGITEAENSAGEQFGDAGLDTVIRLPNLDALLGHLARFLSPNEAQDDWTLLDIRYEGESIRSS
jgi:serine phosphatase RsbU (regulator of sigma subunit)